MIVLYSGTPGSGKSLHTAKYICDEIFFNRPILANFEINFENLKKCYKFKKPKKDLLHYVPNNELTPKYLTEFSRSHFHGKAIREDNITLIIDECQLLFNAREWNKQGREEWLSFFTQHRKYGYYIILVAQFDRMIDRQIRSLIEYEYIHRKVKNMGIGGAIYNTVLGGGLFCCVQRYYPLNERIGFNFFKCRKKYYSIYDTYANF